MRFIGTIIHSIIISGATMMNHKSVMVEALLTDDEFQRFIVNLSQKDVHALMDYTNAFASSSSLKTTQNKNNNDTNKATLCTEGAAATAVEGRTCDDSSTSTNNVHVQSLKRNLKQIYDEYGFVLVRGLLSDDESLFHKLLQAGDHMVQHSKKEFQTDMLQSVKFGPVFEGLSSSLSDTDDDDETADLLSTFRQIALESSLPTCVALLLDLDDSSAANNDIDELRLLNDVFMAKGSTDQSHCGWHIDDATFWPCDPNLNDSPLEAGINAWVAMDDMPSKYGGGMAVVPKFHMTSASSWALEAQHAIGHPISHPPEGFDNFGQLFGTLMKTCALSDLAPAINEQMEQNGIVFDFQKGDVLFMNRFLWHRSMMITEEGKQYYLSNNNNKDETTTTNSSLSSSNDENDEAMIALKRYTIRYERGSTHLLTTNDGISLAPSILVDSNNAGKPLREINGPFYPKCWPTVDPKEMSQLNDLVHDMLPKAQTAKDTILADIFKNMAASASAQQ